MTDVKCDIILPVCGQHQFTKNCIDSVIANTTAVSYRLIVVNNGKNNDTEKYLAAAKARLGEALYIIRNEKNIGWVKALNQGIAISTAPFLCFQNDDTIVTRNWLNRMISVLESDEGIGLVNPVWEGRPRHIPIDAYGDILARKYNGEYIETDWARGFSVVLKREVVKRTGNIDEAYGLAYFDDVDFSVRAINAGFLVVRALDTYVYHHRNATFFQVLKGNRWNELHEKNKRLYYNKWGRPLKVGIILDAICCKDREALKGIKDTVYYLARRQHHIDMWSPCDISKEFSHTNVNLKSSNPFLYWPMVSSHLYMNRRKGEGKRYNAVFIFDGRLGNALRRNGLFDGMPIYVNVAHAEFNAFIKNHVDSLKEDTKKYYG